MLQIIENYYAEKMKEQFPDYEIHGWESMEAHLTRFKVLYDNIKLSGKSILDVGCGVGTLLKYLGERRVKVSYVGVDILEKMVKIAKERNPNGIFLHNNIFEENPFPADSFNIVFASGIFNLDIGDNEAFMQQALHLFGELATDYIVFNSLSVKSNNKEPGYAYFDQQNIGFIIKKSNIKVKKFKVIDNYLQNDFTVIIELDKR